MAGGLQLGYVDSSFGQLHYAQQGSGEAILLLHQAPRSWDEFREFIPLLADDFRVVAMDMPGYGNSAPVPGPQTIETYARGAWELLDTLGVDRVTVIGHHTGAAVALEMAASRPERVHAAVLSSCPWTDRNYREGHSGPGGIDCVDRAADGSHLTRLWEMRRPYYPEPGTALLDRFIRDALAYRVDPAEGHKACARYVMEARVGSVTAPVLLICAQKDPFSMPNIAPLRAHLTGAAVVETEIVESGTVALVEEHAPQIASVVRMFLENYAGRRPV
ncbi:MULTISPECIES: alpha/beta fold hydrolase [Rhodococcus]|uniref:alpha/beta fold hydrolase n=1 Tax=Rhodococcus TaxID=1827 RepID=UPI0007BB54EC|nr:MULTISPECIES: alpha/beta hydrolase [Rhodococcus]KZF18013.1 alpha/beta hydrolase [Rhodococcus sp. EPR-134]MBX9151106.1 alpha/beta hydrolase [Rhodococcus qingshengii]